MVTTIINVIVSSLLSLFAYQVNNVWSFLFFGWIVALLALICGLSLLITGITQLCKKHWLLGCINLIMLIPLLVFSLPMLQIIGA